MDTAEQGKRWTPAQKDAIAEAFTEARDELIGKLQRELDSNPQPANHTVGIVRSYFDTKIETLRSVTAGSG